MYIDSGSGDLKPANNARVSVYAPGTTNLQTIYTTRSAGTTKANPFTTDASGAAEFWAELADYDVKFEDLEVPPRFGTKTIGWQSSNPTVIPFASLDAVTVRQTLPIGAVIAWWRPNSGVGLPAGCVQCDGATYSSAQHDFGTGASITVPDLRNRFILGASSTNTDGQAGNGSDLASGAPGIRGTGGSNSHTLTVAQIGSHSHSINIGGSGSGSTDVQGAHSHTHGIAQRWVFNAAAAPNGLDFNGGSGALSTGVAGSHSHNVSVSVSVSGTSSSVGGDAAHNNIPLYTGLLYIMKIKRD
jgi:microcystin-dependent protein